MVRATAGTWLNYATTIVFQVLFARAYGAGPEASAFVVTFGIALALGGLFVSTGQSIAVPRLMTADGRFASGAVRLLRNINIAAGFILAGLALGAPALADILARRFDAGEDTITALIRLTALFGFLQCVSGQIAGVEVARGRRFLPMLAPGLPTAFGGVYLLAEPHATVEQTMLALNAGGVAQVAMLSIAALRPRIRLAPAAAGELAPLAILTVVQLALLSTVAPTERVLAGLHGGGGAAHFDYALRSLGAVQQIVVGGLAFASLADWSALRPGDSAFMRTLVHRTKLGMLALVGLAGIAAVAAPTIVRLVYQRGDFTAGDTDQVALVLRLALPGFVAAGTGSVLIQAVLAARQNRDAINVGLSRFATRMVLALCLSPWGAPGVAAGYSVAETVALMLIIRRLRNHGPIEALERRAIARSLGVVGGMAVAVALLLALPVNLSEAGLMLVAGLLFGTLVLGLRVVAWPFNEPKAKRRAEVGTLVEGRR